MREASSKVGSFLFNDLTEIIVPAIKPGSSILPKFYKLPALFNHDRRCLPVLTVYPYKLIYAGCQRCNVHIGLYCVVNDMDITQELTRCINNGKLCTAGSWVKQIDRTLNR